MDEVLEKFNLVIGFVGSSSIEEPYASSTALAKARKALSYALFNESRDFVFRKCKASEAEKLGYVGAYYELALWCEEKKQIDNANTAYALVTEKSVHYEKAQQKLEELNKLKEKEDVAGPAILNQFDPMSVRDDPKAPTKEQATESKQKKSPHNKVLDCHKF